MKNLISFPPFALIIMLMILLPISGVGQQKIILKNADSGEDKVDENGTKYTLFKGNVWFIRGTVNIYCNEAHGYGAPDSKVKLFGNVRIIDKDVHITSKNAFYYSETQLIQLREDVVFRQSNGITVYTDFLDYNRDKKVAMYFNGGRLVDKESVLTSKRGYFNEATGMASFKSDVDGKNPEWTLTADTLQYDTRERIIYFHDKTNLVDAKGNMAEYYAGQYNTITKQSQLRTGKFETESYILEGNTIEIDDVKKLYKARGDVFLLSKTDDLIITGESAYYDQLNGITKIYDHPVMKMASAPGDTLYLSADTLLSVETENDSNEVLYAYHHVRVYKSDMQAVSDSLAYFRDDSVIYFYRDPILWAQGTQLTADTINITLINNNLDKLNLINNAFIITKDTLNNFNQVKGRHITTLFHDNKINNVKVEGNGESIYYVLEEQDTKVTGMNKVSCSNMSIRFRDNLIKTIVFYTGNDGTFTPPHKIEKKDTRLNGFRWREKERPLREDVLKKKTLSSIEKMQ